MCATEVTHTEKCITLVCYHTKLFSNLIRERQNRECIFTVIKMIPVSVAVIQFCVVLIV